MLTTWKGWICLLWQNPTKSFPILWAMRSSKRFIGNMISMRQRPRQSEMSWGKQLLPISYFKRKLGRRNLRSRSCKMEPEKPRFKTKTWSSSAFRWKWRMPWVKRQFWVWVEFLKRDKRSSPASGIITSCLKRQSVEQIMSRTSKKEFLKPLQM